MATYRMNCTAIENSMRHRTESLLVPAEGMTRRVAFASFEEPEDERRTPFIQAPQYLILLMSAEDAKSYTVGGVYTMTVSKESE